MLARAGRLAFTLAFLTLGVSPLTLAAATASPGSGEVTPLVPIRIGNRTIATLRGTVLGYTAGDRAAAAERRLRDIVDQAGSAPLKAGTRDVGPGVAVELGGQALFLITPEDVNVLLDETPAAVAQEAARALEVAVAEAREEKQPRALLLGAGRVALVTLIWLLLLRGLYLASHWLGTRLSRRVVNRADKLGVSQLTEMPLARVYLLTRRVVSAAAWVVALFATSTWLSLALESFAWTRPFGEEVQGTLVGLLAAMARAILAAVPGLVVVAVIVVLTRSVVKVMRPMFDRVERGSRETGPLNRYTAATTRRLLTALLWLFALAMAYPYLPGSGTDAFKGLSVLFGVMVSVGASGVVGQAASGLIILYAHALRPGQYIRVGDSEGTVVEIGMFSTRLRTGLGEDVLVPNSFILATTLKNFSSGSRSSAGFVLDTGVTIGYDVPWRQVEAMLIEAARRVPAIAPSPAPYVIQTELADFYVAYRLVASSAEAVPRQRVEVLNDLHAAIQDVFNENGVQIMSPHYVLDPRAPKIVPKERWHEPPARKE
ncbi:MAG TPA: mechanosensitive ion channel [Vicinamibacteria bacterium]|nr:mechanosensitive ion channel [Vicinamibacteria bacterium]